MLGKYSRFENLFWFKVRPPGNINTLQIRKLTYQLRTVKFITGFSKNMEFCYLKKD